jgi:hypothetical protein
VQTQLTNIGVSTMSKIDWTETVQVKMLKPNIVATDHAILAGHLKWDGIDLAEALRRIMQLPPAEQLNSTIFAASGHYDWHDIQRLFSRTDFPAS